MTTMRTFIKQHPVLSYYVLTFAISWGGMLLAVWFGAGGFAITPEQLQAVVPYAVPAMILGPSVAGILLTALVDGRAGLAAFAARLGKWRVGAGWYAFALLVTPFSLLVVLFALSLRSPVFVPRIITTDDKAGLLLLGLAVGLMAGIFEELGWTGFAIPRLRLRYSVLATGLLVGVLWGVWHFFVNFWASGVTAGAMPLAVFLPTWLIGVLAGQLTAFRVLMVWVYERTGSLLVAILMHVSLAAFQFILIPPAAGTAYWTIGFVYAAVTWLIVGAIALANHGKLARPGQPGVSIGAPQTTPG